MTAMKTFVDDIWDREIVPTLCDYIRIPNKSPMFDSQWAANGHMQRAVELLRDWAKNVAIEGLTTRIVTLEGRTPTLLAEIPATAPTAGTVLLYGHYDKQPEFTGWQPGLSPWEPVLRDGKLYGRGGADDGYALFGSLTAIAALQAEQIPHGRCVVLIEGCEESGSFDLPFYVDALRDEIGQPELVVCLDAECGNYGPTLGDNVTQRHAARKSRRRSTDRRPALRCRRRHRALELSDPATAVRNASKTAPPDSYTTVYTWKSRRMPSVSSITWRRYSAPVSANVIHGRVRRGRWLMTRRNFSSAMRGDRVSRPWDWRERQR